MDNFSFYNSTSNRIAHVGNISGIIYECGETDFGALEYRSVQNTIYCFYAIVFLISIVGNGLICYIVVVNATMHTVTNYFIFNLAVGDILITILCVPFTAVSQVLQYWPFQAALCPLVNYAQGVSVFVMSYTMVAISFDRYVAIMWPLRPRMSKRFTTTIILIVWLVALITVLPTALTSTTILLCEDVYICQENWDNFGWDYERMYGDALLVLQYIIPVSVLMFTYTSIGAMIWCHRIPGEAENCRDQRIARSKRKMIKMMVTVVVIYTICWLPLNMFWKLHEYLTDNQKMLFWFLSHWFAMSHSCYNPIIYCYMNSRFRGGLLQTLNGIPCFRNCWKHFHSRSTMNIPLTSVGGSNSAVLQRNNTCTTYVSSKGKVAHSTVRMPSVRSASMLRPQSFDHESVALRGTNLQGRPLPSTDDVIEFQETQM